MQKFFNNLRLHFFLWPVSLLLFASCKPKIKETTDSIYSRHLQKHVQLTIISTPVPDDKQTFNLLLLNDGQNIKQLRVKETLDSLYRKKELQPLVIVGITAMDREDEYGIAGTPDFKKNGSAAGKYEDFLNNELYPFIKKMTGVRKFKTISIAGCELGGVSAFNFAWEHADKIDKVGVFSGAFWLRDKDVTDPTYSDDKDRIVINKIRSSRKRPKLQYWFYAGGHEETTDRDKDGIIDVIDDTKDLISAMEAKTFLSSSDISYLEVATGKRDYNSWSAAFPQFLLWADGK